MPASRILPLVCLLLSLYCPAQPPRLVLPVGHTGLIRDSKFSPDDKLIITASIDKTVKVWDRLTGKELQTLSGHTDQIVSAAISKDGKYVTTASYDKTARVFDIKTGRQLRLVKHTDWVSSSQFSADSKLLLTASKDQSVCLWNVADGKKLFSFTKFKGEVKSALFSPDEKYILCYDYDEVHVLKKDGQQLFSYYPRLKKYDKGGYYGISYAGYNPDGSMIMVIQKDDNSIRLVDAVTGEEKMNIPAHESFINSAYFNSSGSAIVTADGTRVNVWDTKSGKNLYTIYKISPYRLTEARFTPDNKYLIIASFNKTIFFYDPASGKLLHSFDAPGLTGAFSYNSNYMLILPDDYTAIIWDISNRKINQRLRGFAQRVSTARFNAAGDKIVVGGSDSPTRIIDITTGSNLLSVKTPTSTESVVFSPDDNQLLSFAYDSIVRTWDARTGKELMRLRTEQKWLSNATYHPSGKMILAFEPEIINSGNQTARVWETASGRLLFSLKDESVTEQFESAVFSPDGTSIITASSNKVKFWDLQTVKPKKVLNIGGLGAVLSPGGKYLAVEKLHDLVGIHDPNTGALQSTLKGHQNSIIDIAFRADNKWVATSSFDSTARIWDPKSGALLHTLKGHKSWINSVQFHPTNNLVLTSSWDNTVRLWNAITGKLLSTILLIDSTDLISINPAGFYQCTPAAAKRFHYVTKDLKVVTFEQLDVKYNRPDKVQETLGNTDTALIRGYRRAWEKRIKKLGIDTSQFRDGYSVPECDFVNRDAVEYEQKNGTLSLRIRGMDSAYKLDRFNIWVNESPLYGQRGISIRKRNSNSIDTTISIVLSQGENRIETSITNVNGTESYRMPLYVNYTPAVRQRESLRFIGIGIDQFADSKNNLQYSSKDIRDLAIKLKEKYKDALVIDTLFNENVTAENVKALKQKLQGTSVNDRVIISYSGHGLLSKDYDYYLSTYSVNFDKPEENGLPYDELENLLDSIPARKKLMLIDACHSGEVDKEEMVRITAAEDGLKAQGAKGGKPTFTGKTTLGMKNSFELMQSLFVNVGKSTGATIISAAAGTQFALERGDLKNGVFTYCILEAMNKNPTMKISELKRIVGERVEQLTNGLQKPTSRNETIAVDWNL